MVRQIVLIILTVLLVASAFSQDDWHTYPFRDLESVVAGEQSLYEKRDRADMVISAKPFPSKTRVIFAGERRPVSELGISFMKIWAESRNVPASNVDLLLEEFLFLEKGKEYWIPVQKSTAHAIAASLKKGDEVVVCYFYLGGFNARSLHSKHETLKKLENREAEGIRWLFAIERVERPGGGFPLVSISEFLENHSPSVIPKDWIPDVQLKAKIKAEFTGEFRDVSGKRLGIRDAWFEKQGASAAAQLMQTEALFKIENKAYWILLRNRTREHLVEFVKKGDSVFLNTILAGGFRNSSDIDWVLMAGEYSTF